MCGRVNSCARIRCSKSKSMGPCQSIIKLLITRSFTLSSFPPAVPASLRPAMAAIRTCSYALIRSDDRRVPPAPMQPLPASTNIRQRPKSPAAFSTVSHAAASLYSFSFPPARPNPIGYKLLNVLHRLPQLADTDAVCHSVAAHGRPGRGDHLLQARIGLSLENILLRLVAANPGKCRERVGRRIDCTSLISMVPRGVLARPG